MSDLTTKQLKDNPRRLAVIWDALMRLCDAQRCKIERQAAELERLRARLAENKDLANEPVEPTAL